jgi:hypothetical protein
MAGFFPGERQGKFVEQFEPAMKKTMFVSMLSVVMLLAAIPSSPEDPRAMTAIPGYHLRSVPGPAGDFNIWVVTNAHTFDEMFKPGNEGIVRPDFENQFVVAVNAVTSNYMYSAVFTRSWVDKNGLHISFRMRKQKNNEEPSSISLVALEKMPGLKAVHFYNDDVKVRSVPIVAVY